MVAQILYRRHELARALGVDHRVIDRIGLIPTANGPDNRPLYDKEHARKQLETYLANQPRKKAL